MPQCFRFILFAIGKLRNKVSPKNPGRLTEEEEEEKEEESLVLTYSFIAQKGKELTQEYIKIKIIEF